MTNKKSPERAGTRIRAGQIEGRIINMSINKVITFFERRQYRKAIVWLIEAIIGAALVAATILAASLLLKWSGAL